MNAIRYVSPRAHDLTVRDTAGRLVQVTTVGSGRDAIRAQARIAEELGVPTSCIEATVVTGTEH